MPLSSTDPLTSGYPPVAIRPERRAVQPSGSRLRWDELADAIRLLDFGSDALLCLDEGQRVVLCNRGAEQMFGLDSRAMEGINWLLLLAQGSRDLLRDALRRLDKFDHPSNISLRDGALFGLRGDGKEFPIEGSLSRLQLGSSRGYTLLLRDISARVECETRLRYLAMHDSLTKLPNRALLMDRLESAVRRHRRSQKTFALLFIDLDDFKEINDRHGHQHGDQVLMTVASVIRRESRDSDIPARFGGEEFIVLAPETEMDQGIKLARRLLKKIAETGITASLGLTGYPNLKSRFPDDLIRLADEALYEAKRRGKNQIVSTADEFTEAENATG